MYSNGLYTSEPVLHIYGEILSYYSDSDKITKWRAGNCPFCGKLYSPVTYQNKLYGLKEFSEKDVHYSGETLYYIDKHVTFADIISDRDEFISNFESIFEKFSSFFFLQDDLHALISIPEEKPPIISEIVSETGSDLKNGNTLHEIGDNVFLVHRADNLEILWEIFHDNYFLNGNCSFLAFREPDTYYIVMARNRSHKIIFFRSGGEPSEFKELTIIPKVSYHELFLKNKIKPSIREEFKYIPKFDSQLCNDVLSKLFSDRIDNAMKVLKLGLIDTETINNLFVLSHIFGDGDPSEGMAAIFNVKENQLVIKYVPQGKERYNPKYLDDKTLDEWEIEQFLEYEREPDVAMIVNQVRNTIPNFTRLFFTEVCQVLLERRGWNKLFPISVCCPQFPAVGTVERLSLWAEKFEMKDSLLESLRRSLTTKKLFYEELAVGNSLFEIFYHNLDLGPHGFLQVTYQILLALIYSQGKIKFHHLDLHWKNIMVRKLPEPIIMKYVIPGIPVEKTTFLSQYLATIIDYGRSYVEDSDGKSFVPNRTYLKGEMIDGYDLHTFMMVGIMLLFDFEVQKFFEEFFELYLSMSKLPFPEKVFKYWGGHEIIRYIDKVPPKPSKPSNPLHSPNYCCPEHQKCLELSYNHNNSDEIRYYLGFLDLRKPVKGIFPTEKEFFLRIREKFPISTEGARFMMEWGDVKEPGKITFITDSPVIPDYLPSMDIFPPKPPEKASLLETDGKGDGK